MLLNGANGKPLAVVESKRLRGISFATEQRPLFAIAEAMSRLGTIP